MEMEMEMENLKMKMEMEMKTMEYSEDIYSWSVSEDVAKVGHGGQERSADLVCLSIKLTIRVYENQGWKKFKYGGVTHGEFTLSSSKLLSETETETEGGDGKRLSDLSQIYCTMDIPLHHTRLISEDIISCCRRIAERVRRGLKPSTTSMPAIALVLSRKTLIPQSRRNSQETGGGDGDGDGDSDPVVASFWESGGGGVEKVKMSEECPICFQVFESGATVSGLSCSHIFHEDCIDDRLKRGHGCPVCAAIPMPRLPAL